MIRFQTPVAGQASERLHDGDAGQAPGTGEGRPRSGGSLDKTARKRSRK